MVVSLIMLIFIIGEGGKSVGAGSGMAVGSILFSTFIMLLEFLVAIVQAYVFTVLSAVFIGQAMETHSHDHAHDEHHHPASDTASH
jgi:F-type H+-transporting ATPase subunit a